MVELGKESGKKIGEWYGPGAVAHLIKQAVKQSARENLDLASLHVYVAQIAPSTIKTSSTNVILKKTSQCHGNTHI